MSRRSCAASCSTCCHRASYASATSDFLPTATALHSCRCASICSVAQKDRSGGIAVCQSDPFVLELPSLRRRQGVAERPSASHFCSVLRLIQTHALHEYRSASPACARGLVRGSFGLSVRDCSVAYLLSRRLTLRRGVSPHRPTVKAAHPTRLNRCLIPPRPLKPISKYIALHEGGFLQVAVSEAPLKSICLRTVAGGRSRYCTKACRN